MASSIIYDNSSNGGSSDFLYCPIAGSNEAGFLSMVNCILRNGNSMVMERDLIISYSVVEGGFNGDGNIDTDPLFLDPDNVDFHLQVSSPCIDAGDPESDLDPDGTRADMGAYYVHQTSHYIALRQGWNMVSSFNQPRSAAMPDVWSEVVGRGNLFLTKNQSGQFYMPGAFNGMSPWDVRQGYYAKLNEADTLIIVNVPTDVGTPIPLRQGWNLIAYFPEQDLDVRDALAGIVDDVILVKDLNGRFYRPSAGFSNMPPLTRGRGYQLGVSRAGELVYPAGEMMMMSDAEASRGQPAAADRITADHGGSAVEAPTHFQPVELTSANMSLLALIPAEAGIQFGEIGAFTEMGLCVGSTGVTAGQTAAEGGATVGIAVWADDPTTPEIDGAVEGEALNFRYWDGSTEYSAKVKFTEGNGKYTTDGFAQVEIVGMVSQPTEWSLSEPYPNPFNPLTTIKFALLEDSKVRLTIYDLSGREVASLLNRELKAGTHSATWNAEGFTSGIYLVKMETPTFSATKKVTLVK
jgi:hypothetical protein